jgi:hypothetical protein
MEKSWLNSYLAEATWLCSFNIIDVALIGGVASTLCCLLVISKTANELKEDNRKSISLFVLDLCETKRQRGNLGTDSDYNKERGVTRISIVNSIIHDVTRLSISGKGTYAAIYGAKGISVLPLPDIYRLKKAYGELELECFEIDPSVYRLIELKKVIWHPFSMHGSHIFLLSSDDAIRVYDVNKTSEFPEQVLTPLKRHLLPKEQLRLLSPNRFAFNQEFEDDDDIEDDLLASRDVSYEDSPFKLDDQDHIATFVLGSGSREWNGVTLYYVLCNGDVYSICPILPHIG